ASSDGAGLDRDRLRQRRARGVVLGHTTAGALAGQALGLSWVGPARPGRGAGRRLVVVGPAWSRSRPSGFTARSGPATGVVRRAGSAAWLACRSGAAAGFTA